MAPFKDLYGKKCISLLYWDDISEAPDIGLDMIREMTEKLKLIHKQMKMTQDRQAKYANVRRRPLCFEQGIHDVFHVSMLRKYQPDASHILQSDEAELNETPSYFEQSIQILDQKVKQLRNKMIQLVKVQWTRHRIEEATWETEEDMRQRFPELFH
ncbi:uncharacterized protein [Henckelia pumila]|uniref:uncharacterized protein n=1 Tax=Henckelia pumila TaxID=405737 RepID=UPI003C6E1511